MKTNEELKALKAEADALKDKLAELTNEELAQVSGGIPSMDEFQVDLDPFEKRRTDEMEVATGPAEAQVSEKKADIYSPAAQVPNNGADIKKRQRHEYISGGLPDIEL